jgi:Flp pilus assembly pilin Flp
MSSTIPVVRFTKNVLACIGKDEEGVAVVEYGMLLGLITLVCFGAAQVLGLTISGVFTALNTALGNAGLGG